MKHQRCEPQVLLYTGQLLQNHLVDQKNNLWAILIRYQYSSASNEKGIYKCSLVYIFNAKLHFQHSVNFPSYGKTKWTARHYLLMRLRCDDRKHYPLDILSKFIHKVVVNIVSNLQNQSVTETDMSTTITFSRMRIEDY